MDPVRRPRSLPADERKRIEAENRLLIAQLKAVVARRPPQYWTDQGNLGVSHEDFLQRLKAGLFRDVDPTSSTGLHQSAVQPTGGDHQGATQLLQESDTSDRGAEPADRVTHSPKAPKVSDAAVDQAFASMQTTFKKNVTAEIQRREAFADRAAAAAVKALQTVAAEQQQPKS